MNSISVLNKVILNKFSIETNTFLVKKEIWLPEPGKTKTYNITVTNLYP